MIAIATFTRPQFFNGQKYESARISMELGPEKKVPVTGKENWKPGIHYVPGAYTVFLLEYNAPAFRTVHYRTYPLREGTTIGTIIKMILDKKMHHFLFLPYTTECRWKGCGDHLLHCWAELVRSGVITSKESFEEPGKSLNEELTRTYIEGGDTVTWERVGRGWWISYNPVEDEHTPESTFTDGRPSYQLPEAGY